MSQEETLKEECLLVIIEPTNDKHIALERAIITSRLRQDKPRLHLFIAVDPESNDLKARNQSLYRDKQWLDALTAPITDEGLDYSYDLCWSNEWMEAVLTCADRIKPDVMLIPDYEPGVRRSLFTASKWGLLRNSRTPVMIVRPGASNLRKVVLAAVNIQSEKEDDRYQELNEKILSKGAGVAKLYGADFYVVNAYRDSMHYPDRERIMAKAGLESKFVHAEEGRPEDVISSYANEIKADIIVIGTMSRQGAAALMKGNTSEKLLEKISQQDVITYGN